MQVQGNTVRVSTANGIDAGRVEKELASMWMGASEGAGEVASVGVTRACALNLLVYTTKQDDRARLEQMLDEVSQQHPGRTLVLVADAQASEARLDAYASTRCRNLGGNRKQICGEQVTIEASGSMVSTAASAVAPLLVPDVPVFLWWKDIPHYEDKLFNRMAAMADRIVIDSVAFDHPLDDMLRLARLLQENPRGMRVSDLNWGRLTAWRTLIASFWDIPDYRPHLDRIDKVTIEYDPPDIAPDEIAPKALLVLGWLASRLGWQVESTASASHEAEGCAARFRLRAGGHQLIDAEMRPVHDKEESDGMMSSIKFSAANNDSEFHVTLSPDGAKLHTEAMIGGARTVGRILSYEARSEGQRLSRELAFLTRDLIYEEAVAASAALVETLRQ